MFYIVFALVVVATGLVDVDPLIAWMEEQKWPSAVMSLTMITALGIIPALIVGAGIFADTLMRGDRKR